VKRARVVLLLSLLAADGCSILPRFGGGPDVELDGRGSEAPDTSAVSGDAAPSSAAADSASARPSSEDGEASRAPDSSAPSSSQTATSGRSAQPADRSDAAVSIDLGGVERTRLSTQTRRNLAEAERAVSSMKGKPLGADALERLKTVEELIAQARSASDANDIEGASRLAHKARLLASELAANP